jgi:hypothetical protein
MKIIRPGVLPVKNPTVYRGECENCRCQVECGEDDLSPDPRHNVGGTNCVSCPTPGCGLWITVKEVVFRGSSSEGAG